MKKKKIATKIEEKMFNLKDKDQVSRCLVLHRGRERL